MGRVIGAVAIAAAAAAWLIIVAAGDGEIDAGQLFIGLGYIAGAVLVVLVVLVAAWLMRGGPVITRGHRTTDADAARGEQALVLAQLRLGAMLIMVGAVLGIVFGVVVEKTGKVSLAIATAVIGAGAALIPPGAAAGAGERAKALEEKKGRDRDEKGRDRDQKGRDRDEKQPGELGEKKAEDEARGE